MAEIKKAYIVDLNKLKALDENGNAVRPHLNGGASKAILAYVLVNGELTKVYNQAEYVLEAETEMEADPAGVILDPVVRSEKYDYNTATKAYDILAEQNVPYEGILELPPNTTEETITGEFTVTQPKSGLSVVCKYTQVADEWTGTYAYSNFNFVGAAYEDMGAGGGTAYLAVTVSVYRQEIWGSGLKNGKTITSTLFYDEDGILNDSAGLGCTLSFTAKAISGTNAAVNSYTGVVTGYNWGRTLFDGGNIAYAESFVVSFRDISTGSSERCYCYQEPNELVETVYGDYHISLVPDNYSLSATNGGTEITVYASRDVVYSYTAGDYPDSIGQTASVSTNQSWASVNPASVYDEETTLLTVDDNTSSEERGVTVTGSVGDVSAKITLIQEAVEYHISAVSSSYPVPYSVTSVVVQFFSYLGSTAEPFSASNVAVSGIEGAYVEDVSYAGGLTYNVTVNVGSANNTDYVRTLDVTVSYRNKTASTAITQAAQPKVDGVTTKAAYGDWVLGLAPTGTYATMNGSSVAILAIVIVRNEAATEDVTYNLESVISYMTGAGITQMDFVRTGVLEKGKTFVLGGRTYNGINLISYPAANFITISKFTVKNGAD